MEGKMKALVIHEPNKMSLEEVEIPKIKDDEVLVKMEAVGICGTDVEIRHGQYPDYIAYPIIPGHENAGTIVEVGKNVLGFEVGERVAIEPHGGCGQCANCKVGYYSYCLNYGKPGHRTLGFTVNGGFAEYMAAPARNLHRLPDNLSFEEGAVAVSVGTAMFGVMEIGIDAGDVVAVIGPGTIGLTSLMVAKAMGAGKTILIGTRESRLKVGEELGADITVNLKEEEDPVKTIMELTKNVGADLVINTVPSPESVSQGIKMLRRGGRFLMLGMSWEPTPVVFGEVSVKGITIKGTRGEARNALKNVLRLAEVGKLNLKRLVTHRYKFEDVVQAFDDFENRVGDPIKVVINP